MTVPGSSTRSLPAVLAAAALVVVAAVLHLAGADRTDVLPPYGLLEQSVVYLPLLAHAAALGLLVVRRDVRGLQGACLLQWLLVIYLLPAGGTGLLFAPSALVLSLALWQPWVRAGSGPAAAG